MKTTLTMALVAFSISILSAATPALAGEQTPSAAQLSLPGEIVSEISTGAAASGGAGSSLLHASQLSLQGEVVERALAPSGASRPELPAFACLR